MAFIGQDEHGTLRDDVERFHVQVLTNGLIGHVIDISDPAWPQQLERIGNEGIFFAWAFAGVGAALTHLNGENYWEAICVPFISVFDDNPAQNPKNHKIPARYVVNSYTVKDWLDIQRQIIRSPQIATLLPSWAASNPYRNNTPWKDRAHHIVFLKNGGDPDARRREWSYWPRQLRTILEETAEQALHQTTGDLMPLFLSCLDAHGVDLSEGHHILFGMFNEIDWYIRLARLTKMARALCRVDATIIGARWEHIDKTGAKASFHPGINGREKRELFANSKFIVNTSPNNSLGAHERVLLGFGSKACVVSDSNDYSRALFSGCPTFFGFDWADPDWEEKVVSHLESGKTFDDEAFQPALDILNQEFCPHRAFQVMVDIAETVRFGNETLSPYNYISSPGG